MDTLWHITRDGTPAAPGAEAFVHCSFPHQLAGSLEKHYADAQQVVLLRLDPGPLGDTLVLEPSRGGQDFPHIYGPVLAESVLERVSLSRCADGRFDLSALAGAGPA